jgi:hypothetical protein
MASIFDLAYPQVSKFGPRPGAQESALQLAQAQGYAPNAIAADQGWQFGPGAPSIFDQRGLIERGGMLVPKAAVYGSPVHDPNNPNMMRRGYAGIPKFEAGASGPSNPMAGATGQGISPVVRAGMANRAAQQAFRASPVGAQQRRDALLQRYLDQGPVDRQPPVRY